MLPTLPKHLPGLEVAARYRPSRDGLDIGGDWYDAFVMPDGAIALEIGDAQGTTWAPPQPWDRRASMRAIAAHEPDPGTRADADQRAARHDGRGTIRQLHHAAYRPRRRTN